MSERNKIHASRDTSLNIAWAAHGGAAPGTASLAEEFMSRFIPPDTFRMTDSHPDIILFMSGGSERRAIELADPERPVLLLSIRGNNAYASATEVMAWMTNNGRIAILSDAADAAESGLLGNWQRVAAAWNKLKGSTAGLAGNVSEWLVASDVSAETLLGRFGISLKAKPWSGLPDFTKSSPDRALMKRFDGQDNPDLEDAARVLTLLRRVIRDNNLDAIAVECFSLVQERKVTACLALAQLNAEGAVAACEGDLASMAGMMAVKALTGSVPWMANTTRLTEKSIVLSHCTVPFDLVKDMTLRTHYETGFSLAVDGEINASKVTVCRFSEKLDRAFIADGRIISRPRLADACRTQVEIAISQESVRELMEKPLGNHLLLLPGNHGELLRLACRYKGIAFAG
ncbi:MAG TPA: hypothetical protein PKJ71_11685 [Bacteroidales bacterium]|nr:hypothetical protein [Bacteroidales bacterium]